MAVDSESEIRGVVLIDDNPDDLMLLRRALLKGEVAAPIHSFERAVAAAEFLRAFAEANRDSRSHMVVFCDLRMPEMDGFAVLRWVRRNALSDRLRLILISGCALQSDVERAQELGADGYLEKMPSVETLVSCLVTASFPPTGSRPECFKSWEAARARVIATEIHA